jgi:hypothetical protein
MSSLSSEIRLVLAAVLFACVFFASPWLTAVAAAALALRWRAWEVVVAGMLMDFLWLPAPVSFLSFETLPYATLISIIVVVGLEPLRRQLLVATDI